MLLQQPLSWLLHMRTKRRGHHSQTYQDCLELVPQHYGEQVDLAQLPQDGEVYGSLQKADIVGMFRVECRAQMASMPRNYPTRFYHIVVQVAITGPGPIVGKMVHPYMRRRQEKSRDLFTSLARAGAEPHFGCSTLLGAVVAHCHDGRQLHRCRGRRITPRCREAALLGADDKSGINTTRQNDGQWAWLANPRHNCRKYQLICSLRISRIHAASFALIAYASAYFKVNYLATFACAILNNQPVGLYSHAVLVKMRSGMACELSQLMSRYRIGIAPWNMKRMARYPCGWDPCAFGRVGYGRLAGRCGLS
jgi:error-prone DNA polymerase